MNSGSDEAPRGQAANADASGVDPHAAELRVAETRRLDGQVAVITGGGGVIGAAIARRFAGSGAQVVIGDLDAARAEAAARDAGGAASGHALDVSSQEACHAFIRSTGDRLGRIDVLVCAAGIIHDDALSDVDAATWRRVFAVNLEGALYCLQAAARIMREQPIHPATGRRGSIVNIGSQGSEFPLPTSTAYGASKRALIYLTESAAVDLAEAAIGVSVILPGMVYDGMWKDVNLSRSETAGQDFVARMDHDLSETPSGRFQPPEELADIVLFAATTFGLGSSGKTIWSEAHVA